VTSEVDLRTRVRELESANRQHLEFLDLVLSLDNSLVGIRHHKNAAALLAVVAAHVRRLVSIEAVGFFLVQPDFSYELAYSDPEAEAEALKERLAPEIDSGVFAWALHHNRALIRPDGDGAVVLHPIATPSRTLGMVLCRAVETPDERGAGMTLLSVILSTAAYALENAALYLDASERNIYLERVVEERTRKARAAQRQLEAASRAKSDFLSTLSHEIRTPLTGIMGTANLLLGTPLQPAQREYGETILRCGQLTLELVSEILDYTRAEAGKLQLERRTFSLARLLDDVLLVVAQQAAARDLDLGAVVDGAVPDAVEGDPHRLRQVLLNLVGNAVKFTDRGAVVVSVAPASAVASERAFLRVSVRDTGRGIPAGALKRIFDPFEQRDASVSRTHGGSGLGLAISQRIVERMGGQIGVESTVGVGSEFFFSVSLTPAAAAPEDVPLVPRAALKGCRALVVDDRPTRRSCLVQQLATWNLSVDARPDADSAFALLAGSAPPAVVLAPSGAVAELAARLSGAGLPRPTFIELIAYGAEAPGRAAAARAALIGPVRPWALRASLAAALATDAAPPPAAEPARATPGAGLSVLVVDDNAVNRVVAAQMVEQLGARAEIAEGGRAAVAAHAQRAFDCILMDCRMPDLDGIAASTEIRKAEAASGAQRAYIVALTASASEDEREGCLAAGMDAFVTKPATLEDLALVLERSRASRAVT
jgi:signal transduction histidine kinase/CheY-like chemotaxis protein